MAPKVSHYCYFGGSPVLENELVRNEPWYKQLSGYEVKSCDVTGRGVRCCNCVEVYDSKDDIC